MYDVLESIRPGMWNRADFRLHRRPEGRLVGKEVPLWLYTFLHSASNSMRAPVLFEALLVQPPQALQPRLKRQVPWFSAVFSMEKRVEMLPY